MSIGIALYINFDVEPVNPIYSLSKSFSTLVIILLFLNSLGARPFDVSSAKFL